MPAHLSTALISVALDSKLDRTRLMRRLPAKKPVQTPGNATSGTVGRLAKASRTLWLACRLLISIPCVLAAANGRGQYPLADDFNPVLGENPYVASVALQADGGILAAGGLVRNDGQMASHLARFYPDGTLDTNFLGIVDLIPRFSSVRTLAVQNDGKILVGGVFQSLNGQPRSCIGRFHADGSLDFDFNPGADADVLCMLEQSDGRIVVGGVFSRLDGQARAFLGRLLPDGRLDSEFDPGADGAIYTMVEQPDGKLLVGGYFSTMGGQPHIRIARIHADGTIDAQFNPDAGSTVEALALQVDGKILVSGVFHGMNSFRRNHIARLLSDGSLDFGFNPNAEDLPISMVVQADGRIVLGGWFTEMGGQTRSYIARLHSDGTVDNDFNPEANDQVRSLAIQADGKILVGGTFSLLGGQPREGIGRLNNTGPATESLSFDGSTITWLRAGSGPEIWQTTFDHSVDRLTWVRLGQGTRISGQAGDPSRGWELTGVSLPMAGTIRARGRVFGGLCNNTSWFVESFLGAPDLVLQPISRTNKAGTTATFYFGFEIGTQPLSYLWFKNGVPLADGGNVVGATTSTLRLGPVLRGDEGAYTVQVGTAGGLLTSAAATLTVIDPCIRDQPRSHQMNSGESTTLSVTAAGTAPMNLQWWKDGVPIYQSWQSNLTLANVEGKHAGSYWVVASNPHGSVTSEVAFLTVNLATLDQEFSFGAVGSARALAVQFDQKLLIGGNFKNPDGQLRNSLIRLHPDGTIDTNFNLAVTGAVQSLVVQMDKRILLGGYFTNINGEPRNYIARLNPDGTLDTGFNPGAGNAVFSLVIQSDGKIVAGGSFTTMSGQPRSRLARLHPDGTLDDTFNPSADQGVSSLVLQPDGKILLTGGFSHINGQSRFTVARLHPDGTLDAGFTPPTNLGVAVLALQPDGTIVVGGKRYAWNWAWTNIIERLTAEGLPDVNFHLRIDTHEELPTLLSLLNQTDGKILVGGLFRTLNGKTNQNIARLHRDGSLDTSFRPRWDYGVSVMAIQADGKVLAGGWFAPGVPESQIRIARLNNSEPAVQHLSYDASTITWLRGGTSPEIEHVIFDHSTDGLVWNPLGTGSRLWGTTQGWATGWELTNVSLPPLGALRARGYARSGQNNGSGWYVEAMAPVIEPKILLDDGQFGFHTNRFGFNLRANLGTVVVVECSSNLEHWVPLATNIAPGEPWYFADPNATNWPRRFYRFKME